MLRISIEMTLVGEAASLERSPITEISVEKPANAAPTSAIVNKKS
jgi:hypothetical protein